MVIYKFSLQVKNSPERYDYVLDLNSHQEDYPEQIFTPEIRKSMQTTLQQKSVCSIRTHHLDQMIKSWLEDIREGYRETSIFLDLPLMAESNIDQLQEQGNQELPKLIHLDLLNLEPVSGMLPSLDEIFNP